MSSKKQDLAAMFPFVSEHVWYRGDQGKLYAWSRKATCDDELQDKPEVIDLGNDVSLSIYRTDSKVESLYSLGFGSKPPRMMLSPFSTLPITVFWSYGNSGGASSVVKYFYRDKFLSVHGWIDKNSYLAVLRNNHYTSSDYTFWSR